MSGTTVMNQRPAAAVLAERRRVLGIRALARPGAERIIARAIGNGWSVDHTRQKLAALADSAGAVERMAAAARLVTRR